MTEPAPRPPLHLVDAQTGEIVEDERDLLLEQYEKDLTVKRLRIGKLEKELRHLRSVEPESEAIREILEYCRERWGRRFEISPGGKRWEKVRARFRDRIDGRDPWTPEELKLAADGALLDPWLSGRDKRSKGYLDPETVYRDPEIVERLRDLALGFGGKAGIGLGDLLDFVPRLGQIGWKDVLRVCMCGHTRLEHSRGVTEGCLVCTCEDFDLDVFDDFNQRLDPHLKRFFG